MNKKSQSNSLEDIAKSSKFKRHSQNVEKILSTFDAVSEWADVIGFLTRLSKALSSSSHFKLIPHKHLITKRLAQCLNPALPSGVHQKTLEVYSIIFQTIGPEGLSKDLALYSYGLFPLLQYSAMNVKPQLLNLYEKYYLPLGEDLKPCMKSFIIALLPGFEDEGNEYYEQTYNLMDKLCNIVGEEYFYHCLFLGIITSKSQRLYAFSYILKKFKKPTSAEEMNVIFKGNMVICSKCIAASLLDNDLLVQRSALELLVSYLPVCYEPFTDEDLDVVVSSAVTVVLRKDMSLNRRLYSWFLGIVNEGSKPYLSEYIKTSICRSIKKMLLVKEEFQKPYKILLSLLDDSRIGLIIVDELFIDILISVYHHYNNSDIGDELINTVNMFLSNVEPYIIWSNIFHNLEKHSPKDEKSHKEIYQLFEFLLSFIKITDEEAEIIHLPFCFSLMIQKLNEIDEYEKYKDNIIIYMRLILTFLNRISKNSFKFTESKINELKSTPVGVYITSDKFNEYSFINDYYKMQMSNIIDSYNNRLSPNASKFNNENMSDSNPELMSSIVENATVDHCSYVAHCGLKKSLLILYNIYEHYTLKCIFGKEKYEDLELQCQNTENYVDKKYTLNEKSLENQRFEKWKLEIYGYFCSLIYDLSESSISPFKLEFVPIEHDYIFSFKDSFKSTPIYQSYDKYGRKVYGKIVSSQPDKSIPNWILLLKECCISIDNFQIIDASLLLLLDVISKKNIVIKEIISDNNFIVRLIEKLWNYLSNKCTSYHIQTVKLILELCKYVPSTYTIEKLFSAYLNSSEYKQVNFNKFGIFWKIADTMVNPATLFSQPLFILFDTLFSNEPQERQMGEQWFKSYVKDICVCFDPLLQILHNSLISRSKEELTYENSNVINYNYVKEINFDQINYAFGCIISLISNITQPIIKKLWKTPVKSNSLLNKYSSLYSDYNYDSTNVTYGEFITLTCLIFIQSETPPKFSENYKLKNESIQLQSGKLLLMILSFIPREKESLNNHILIIQNVVLTKLLYCIYNEKLKIQIPLLKILNITVHLTFPKYKDFFSNVDAGKFIQKMNERKSSNNKTSTSDDNNDNNSVNDLSLTTVELNEQTIINSKKSKKIDSADTSKIDCDEQTNEEISDVSYIFLQTVLNALSFKTNRPLLLYWIEFLLSCIQTLQISFFIFAQPVIQCLCDELENYMTSMKNLSEIFKNQADISESEFKTIKEGLYNDNDAQIILYGLERLFKYCLTNSPDESEDMALNYGFKSLSNYVSSIFINNTEDVYVDENSKTKIQEWLLGNLPKIFTIFQQIWSIIDDIVELSSKQENGVSRGNLFYDDVPIAEFLYTGDKYKSMIKRFLNSMYRINYVYVIESLIEVWLLECIENEKTKNSSHLTNSVFQMMKSIDDCSPIAVIQTIITNLRRRRHQKNKAKILKMPELTIIYFWEIYTKQIEDDKILKDLWQTIVSFIKDTLQQSNSNRILFYSILRLLTTIIERLLKTDMFEDKGLRKDQQDIFQRILDICIAQCQKIFESSSWVNTLSNNQDNTNASTYVLCPPSDIENSKFSVQKDEMGYVEIIIYISNVVFPIIRKILIDQEKVINACNNISYYIISNVFKNRNEETIALVVTLDLIIEMMKISYTHRCYRKEIWEMFYNAKFFKMNLKISSRWKKIMNTIVQSENEKLNDLMSRITTGSPTNIFLSRDQELANRALMLRRLAYIIFSGENDQYLKQLPLIQEKIVELLKESNNFTNIEVYLFLRVLFRRISAKHLANFWPVIFTELFNLFEKYIDVSDMTDKEYTDEELKLLLSSFKFLELLIVLAPQEFQLHQWIFIGETNEMVNNDNIEGELAKLSLIDKLKYVWMKSNSSENEEASTPNTTNITMMNEENESSDLKLKKLLITAKQISDKKQINEFVCCISKNIYNSTLQLSPIDTEFIDLIIESDLLDLKETEL